MVCTYTTHISIKCFVTVKSNFILVKLKNKLLFINIARTPNSDEPMKILLHLQVSSFVRWRPFLPLLDKSSNYKCQDLKETKCPKLDTNQLRSTCSKFD